jgi:hypothetical protein
MQNYNVFVQRAASRGQPLRERLAAASVASRYERCQPLRAAVGLKIERIINAGSVHAPRDVALRRSQNRKMFNFESGVALRSAVRSGQTR